MSGESESEEWWFDVRPKGVGKKRPRPIDEPCSESSDSSSPADATSARCYATFAANVASSRSARRPECSSSSKTKPRPKGPGRSGGPMHGRDIHRCRRSECRSEGRHCFAWDSRDAPDAGASTGERWAIAPRQVLVDAVAGDQSTDRHPDTDIDVHVTSQPCFLGREAGANALVSRTQKTSRECTDGKHVGLWRVDKGEENDFFPAKHRSSFPLKDVGGTRLGGTFGRSCALSVFCTCA